MSDIGPTDETPGRKIQRNYVKRGDSVRIAWQVKSLRFVAEGTVEIKPFRPEGVNNLFHAKLARSFCTGWREASFTVVSPDGGRMSIHEAGAGWDGWPFLPEDAKYFRLMTQ